MGVLACDRSGCENIMCDRCNHEHGYICYSCFDELVATNPDDIDQFMNTKPAKCTSSEDPYDKFDKIFEDRDS